MSISGLKWGALVSFVIGMVVILWGGYLAKDKVPPYPQKVVGDKGEELFDKRGILSGQDVYQKYGLMDHGSVWGHGSLRGLDFSATTAHLIGERMREFYASQNYKRSFQDLTEDEKRGIELKVIDEIKTNRFNSSNNTLRLTSAQVSALRFVEKYWEDVFSLGDKRYGFLPTSSSG